MSQNDTNTAQSIGAQSIGLQAELESWQRIRQDTCQQLMIAISISLVYLLASLGVGAYLLLAVEEVSSEIVFLDRSWDEQSLQVSWLKQLAIGYGVIAIIAVISYPILVLFTRDKLPALPSEVISGLPLVGSTMRAVSTGILCQSIYQSVQRHETYAQAFLVAANSVKNASLRHWCEFASRQLEAGQSLANVLPTSPMKEQSLTAVSAFVTKELNSDKSAEIWHQAAWECHRMAESRLQRTRLFLRFTCLAFSILIAFLALFLSGTSMQTILQGLSSTW